MKIRNGKGRFVKGYISPIKGKKLSREHIKNIKDSHKNLWKNREHPKGMLGKKCSIESNIKRSNSLKKTFKKNRGLVLKRNKKISKANKGRKITWKIHKFEKGHIPWNKGLKKEENPLYKRPRSKITKEKIGIKNKGKILTEDTKKKISVSLKKLFINKKGNRFGKCHTKESIIKIKNKRAKQIFPIKDTKIELKIQGILTKLHIEYFTHKYISEITHSYQCDIFIPKQNRINQKTIIECDGCFFHCCPICNLKEFEWTTKIKERDKLRTKELIEQGFNVIRLWEHEIKSMTKEELVGVLI